MNSTAAPHTQAGFLQHPLVWTVIGVLGMFAVSVLVAGPPILAVVGAVAAVALYWAVMRYLARRPAPEISSKKSGWYALVGIGLGVLFVGASMAALLTEFSIRQAPDADASKLWTIAAVSLGGAVTEELIFRGFLLQSLERLCGSWLALAITALLFGGLHLANPGASLWSSLAIAIEAGVLMGAAFLWKRNIWLVVGLHWAWNTIEGLLGIPVSGHTSAGLFVTTPTGPALLTGGDFGLEASIVPVIVGLLLAVPMLIAAHRGGRLVRRG
jgi:uncharacterized protein